MNTSPKTATPYNQDKLFYQPIFSKEELLYLEALNNYSNSQYLMSPRNIETFAIEFAYTSAVLEGNTYTPTEAQLLFTAGMTAGNSKKFEEALMLKNMRNAFDYLVNEVLQSKKDSPRPFVYLLKNAHSIASEMILNKDECGSVRKEPVMISMSSYVPSSIPQELQTGLEIIESEYNKIQNPFEKAVYVHQNLAYLQYFTDHSKRTARNMCAYTLMAHEKMPVIFTEKSAEEYAKAVVAYYESEPADYSKFKDYFIGSYERVCSRMNAYAVEHAQSIVKLMSSQNLKESYPKLSDSQVLELQQQRDMTLERWQAPKAQIKALEYLVHQITQVESKQIQSTQTKQDTSLDSNEDKGR